MATDGVLPELDGVLPDLLPDKDKVYFNDYSTLVQQQGMLGDSVRTSLYQFAMLENKADFEGKRVVDVGAGSGVLSFFAEQAGAAKVFAVEASGVAEKAKKLVAANGLASKIEVVNKRVEEVELDEKVRAPESRTRLSTGLSTRAREPAARAWEGHARARTAKRRHTALPIPPPSFRAGGRPRLGASGHRAGQRAHARELPRRA
jgi:SAM-dependent methyltransferase